MARVVRIYRPARTAMQSGRGNTRQWVLEFEPTDAKRNDGLMGWAGSSDTQSQVRLRFATKEAALAYAQRQGWKARVSDPQDRALTLKSYSDNFAFRRVG